MNNSPQHIDCVKLLPSHNNLHDMIGLLLLCRPADSSFTFSGAVFMILGYLSDRLFPSNYS